MSLIGNFDGYIEAVLSATIIFHIDRKHLTNENLTGKLEQERHITPSLCYLAQTMSNNHTYVRATFHNNKIVNLRVLKTQQ